MEARMDSGLKLGSPIKEFRYRGEGPSWGPDYMSGWVGRVWWGQVGSERAGCVQLGPVGDCGDLPSSIPSRIPQLETPMCSPDW